MLIDKIHKKHPHVRGEDIKTDADLAEEAETPPRAWGRHHETHPENVHSGNTPTCVGKTRAGSARSGP